MADDYSPVMRYVIRSVGHYLMALGKGEIEPLDKDQKHFVRVVRGEEKAGTEEEKEWPRFLREHPEVE